MDSQSVIYLVGIILLSALNGWWMHATAKLHVKEMKELLDIIIKMVESGIKIPK